MFNLRPYQQQAVEKLLWSKDIEGGDLCILPTGAGKSLVIADLAAKLNRPILILQPTKEILEQNVAKMRAYVDDSQIGIYSASVGRKDKSTYTFATIQSIYRKPEEFLDFGYIIVDEAHLVNPKNLDGMFTTFLNSIGSPKVVGLTATPYRMDIMYEHLPNGGLISHTTTKLINRMGKTRFWHRIIFNINNQDLINMGYLRPLQYIDKSIFEHSEIPTNISRSDFDLSAYSKKLEQEMEKILEAIFFAQELGSHVLVFCASVNQAEELSNYVEDSEVVTSQSSKRERERIIREFRSGKIQTVFNVGVLTTGFDFPELDCIVLLRPTQSIGLYYQMLGRGVRVAEGKDHCKLIDLTGTVKKLGKIESIRLERQEKWELLSEKGSWHNKPLYSFEIRK